MTTKEERLHKAARTPDLGCNGHASADLDDNSSDCSSVEKHEEGPDEKGDGKTESFSFSALSSRKKATLLQLAFADFAACACFSLLGPFFPAVAAEKDMSVVLIGLVFSCFELCIFSTSPIFGNYISIIGPKFAFIGGQSLCGFCSLLFGFLYMVPPGAPFIALCFTLRIAQGLGASAYVTASFALLANEFPENVGAAFGMLETCEGIGFLFGTLLGGVLYEVGGFGTPFFVMGSLLIVGSAINRFLLKTEDDVGKIQQKKRGSMLRLFKSPQILVALFCVVMTCYTFGFLDAFFAIYLQQFKLSPGVVAILFIVVSALYCISSPLFGWLSDKGIVYPYMIIGCIVNSIGMLLIGPSPLLPFLHAEIWLVVISLIMVGPAVCAALIPALKCLYAGARHVGFQDGLDLDGLLTGVLNSAIHFGFFLGPTIGSPVVQEYGFEWSATLNAFFTLSAAMVMIAYVIVEKSCLHYDDDKNPSDVITDTTILTDAPDGHIAHTTDTYPP